MLPYKHHHWNMTYLELHEILSVSTHIFLHLLLENQIALSLFPFDSYLLQLFFNMFQKQSQVLLSNHLIIYLIHCLIHLFFKHRCLHLLVLINQVDQELIFYLSTLLLLWEHRFLNPHILFCLCKSNLHQLLLLREHNINLFHTFQSHLPKFLNHLMNKCIEERFHLSHYKGLCFKQHIF